MYSYAIGNKEKTKFLKYDTDIQRSVVVSDVSFADKYYEDEANRIIDVNKNTRFYLIHGLMNVYKIKHEIIV